MIADVSYSSMIVLKVNLEMDDINAVKIHREQ